MIGLAARLVPGIGVPPTQAVVAGAAGVSKSYVGVLERRVAAMAWAVGAPVSLLSAIDVVSGLGVTTAAAAGLAVWKSGCSTSPVHPSSLLLMATRFGLVVPWDVVPGQPTLVGARGARSLVRKEVTRALFATPAVQLHELAGEVAVELDVAGVLVAARTNVVRRGKWVLVLDPTAFGRLGAPVVRMLRLAPAPLSELLAGVQRALRWRRGAPTGEGLEYWLDVQPWITRSGERYRLVHDPGEPVRSDQVLIRAFAGRRPPLGRGVLEQALMTAGYTPAAAPMLVSVSPILRPAGETSMLRLVDH